MNERNIPEVSLYSKGQAIDSLAEWFEQSGAPNPEVARAEAIHYATIGQLQSWLACYGETYEETTCN